jgi:hypothetical protein
MKTLLTTILIVCSMPLFAQAKAEAAIILEPLQPGDMAAEPDRGSHGSDCNFSLMEPSQETDVPNVVLVLLGSPGKFTPIRLNGNLVQLENDPTHDFGPKKLRLKHAWRSGNIKVVLICHTSGEGESMEYLTGTIEIHIDNQSKIFKVTGSCGC